ncbi:hypothetical protein PHLCEN_2v769 [Hermanssonia centrifuga]|uniref:CNNM transmembrane domain-containing protein n=1 Tax=Hermanssonia centrifuga TaxID=98765 RepID=A0A2R6S557_9APHY|nr:hypothetical protein PHLCEN_2v769 [Hermanssonia centrifuga]
MRSITALSLISRAYASPFIKAYLKETKGKEGLPPDTPDFWWHIVLSIGLVLAGGVFAGLTLGLMGLDELHLRVLSTSSDDPVERENANKGSFLKP